MISTPSQPADEIAFGSHQLIVDLSISRLRAIAAFKEAQLTA